MLTTCPRCHACGATVRDGALRLKPHGQILKQQDFEAARQAWFTTEPTREVHAADSRRNCFSLAQTRLKLSGSPSTKRTGHQQRARQGVSQQRYLRLHRANTVHLNQHGQQPIVNNYREVPRHRGQGITTRAWVLRTKGFAGLKEASESYSRLHWTAARQGKSGPYRGPIKGKVQTSE